VATVQQQQALLPNKKVKPTIHYNNINTAEKVHVCLLRIAKMLMSKTNLWLNIGGRLAPKLEQSN